MASTSSGNIAKDDAYTLGDYTFSLARNSVASSNNDQITALCANGEKSARMAIQISASTKIESYRVEASENEATVYATVKVPKSGGGATSDLVDGEIIYGNIINLVYGKRSGPLGFTAGAFLDGYAKRLYYSEIVQVQVVEGPGTYSYSKQKALVKRDKTIELTDIVTDTANASSYTHNGKTVYYIYSMGFDNSSYYGYHLEGVGSASGAQDTAAGKVAWTMKYGNNPDPEYETKEMLVGRFAIDLEDADPESWIDPGDYDSDWDYGDPTETLHVDVIGALSGRHNDPIYDPSYSYSPSDKATVKQYGSGGDGGHGGGGGAGASTVVVHRIATDKAGNHEVTALAKRHGYGSGGGKGGKAGNGIILVYY